MLRLRNSWAIALLILAAQLSALAGEVAVLRNGFSIRHQRREQKGEVTRLYTAEGYVDIPTEQIVSFEVEEEAPAPQPAETQPSAAAANVAQPATVTTIADLDLVVREASAKRQIDPDFVTSVIKAESNFYPRAVSPKGAQGLMQLMPGTAAKLGVSNPFDPKANVEAGTTYLSQLLDLYNNDPIRALAAYNAGPQRVEQYHGVPPYRETQLYIARIVRDFNAKKAKQKAQLMVAQNPEKTRPLGKKNIGNSTARKTTVHHKPRKEQHASLSLSQSPAEAK